MQAQNQKHPALGLDEKERKENGLFNNITY